MGEIFSFGSLYIKNDDGTYSPIGEVQDCSEFVVSSECDLPDPVWFPKEFVAQITMTHKQQREMYKLIRNICARDKRMIRRFIRWQEKIRRLKLKKVI